MHKRKEEYRSWREEQFHEAIRQWLYQTRKKFGQEDDIEMVAQFLSIKEQGDIAKWLGMTLGELKDCLVHRVVYPNQEQAKRWKWYDNPPGPFIIE